MDSKRIASAKRIRDLATKIREVPGIATSVVAIGPERCHPEDEIARESKAAAQRPRQPRRKHAAERCVLGEGWVERQPLIAFGEDCLELTEPALGAASSASD